jgi:hypothetical protein
MGSSSLTSSQKWQKSVLSEKGDLWGSKTAQKERDYHFII